MPGPVQLYEAAPGEFAVTTVKVPAHVSDLVGPGVIIGSGVTVTETMAFAWQPVVVFVPVTVYMVVDEGITAAVFPVIAPGFQV